MDSFIRAMPAAPDDDLMIAPGVAYQRDMNAGRVFYGPEYLARVAAYADTPVARAVNSGRCALLARHLASGASVLDVGAGDGAFVRCAQSWGFHARGFDVIPEAVHNLRLSGLYDEDPVLFDGVTAWDALEHMEVPALMLRRVRRGAVLCLSLPIFDDLHRVRESKHYRRGEHLYYFTSAGLVDWLALYGFRLLEISAHETDAGRDAIGAFAFCRDGAPA